MKKLLSKLLFVSVFTLLFCIGKSVNAELTTDLQIGSRGKQVQALQQSLKTLGFFTDEPSGYFGNVTKTAVISFQKAQGIVPAKGFVGLKTRSKINNLVSQNHVAVANTPISAAPSLSPGTALMGISRISSFIPSTEEERRDRRRAFMLTTLATHLDLQRKRTGEQYPLAPSFIRLNDQSINFPLKLYLLRTPDDTPEITKRAMTTGYYSTHNPELFTDPKDPEFSYEYQSNGKTYTLRAYLEAARNCATQAGNCTLVIQGPIPVRSQDPDRSSCKWVTPGSDYKPQQIFIYFKGDTSWRQIEHMAWKRGLEISPYSRWLPFDRPDREIDVALSIPELTAVTPDEFNAYLVKLRNDKDLVYEPGIELSVVKPWMTFLQKQAKVQQIDPLGFLTIYFRDQATYQKILARYPELTPVPPVYANPQGGTVPNLSKGGDIRFWYKGNKIIAALKKLESRVPKDIRDIVLDGARWENNVIIKNHFKINYSYDLTPTEAQQLIAQYPEFIVIKNNVGTIGIGVTLEVPAGREYELGQELGKESIVFRSGVDSYVTTAADVQQCSHTIKFQVDQTIKP